MRAIVVYESLWGNTAAVAGAIAEGLGADVPSLTTDEATPEIVSAADLIVVGSPVLGFTLPTEEMRAGLGRNPGGAPAAPDVSHPSMRSWLRALPPGDGGFTAFETRVRGPWGSAVKQIAASLAGLGYTQVADPVGFIVRGRYGPLRDGEIERARAWGEGLRR